MVFSSITFIIFFMIVAFLILLTQPKFLSEKFGNDTIRKTRHIILLISSYVFYGWWDWRFCFLMFLLTFISYICAKMIDSGKNKKFFKCIGIVFPLLILGIFKYFNFFIDSFAALFAIKSIGTLSIILPVGISFYTFQSMSYTIDVIRKNIKSAGFINTALYISFFPQLVAGPIVKASDFLPQLNEDRKITLKNLEIGIQIFVFGLFKKIVIADNISVFVDDVFRAPAAFHSISIILAVISYSIQIYFDFSGYSDMAVGCAKCLGYDFNKNFNLPYLSKNVSEFWKRWHISLSSWLQQYLYIPLGGNRKGVTRTYINLLITMVLGGLWHGASWNFVFWGLLHGTALCVHKLYKSAVKHRHDNFKVLRIILTYVFVALCWIPFRASNINDMLEILKGIFIWRTGIIQIFSWSIVGIIVVAIGFAAAIIRSNKEGLKRYEGFYPILNLSKFLPLTLFLFFLGITLIFSYTGNNPFIYFQF